MLKKQQTNFILIKRTRNFIIFTISVKICTSNTYKHNGDYRFSLFLNGYTDNL